MSACQRLPAAESCTSPSHPAATAIEQSVAEASCHALNARIHKSENPSTQLLFVSNAALNNERFTAADTV